MSPFKSGLVCFALADLETNTTWNERNKVKKQKGGGELASGRHSGCFPKGGPL